MKINEISLLDVIPAHMRDDRNIRGFARAWDYMYSYLNECMKSVSIMENLHNFTEETLDEIAETMGIPWYDTGFEKSKKIAAIEHYEHNCFELGTMAAVMRVIEDCFSDVRILQWYEYGGKPFRFRIVTTDELEGVDIEHVLLYIARVKPVKAILESIDFLRSTVTTVYTGSAVSNFYTRVLVKQSGNKVFVDRTVEAELPKVGAGAFAQMTRAKVLNNGGHTNG